MRTISEAKAGDTIYVGDIDFDELPPGWQTTLNSSKRLIVNKSLTIKSGKPDGSAAVFAGGSFILSGPILDAQSISCNFENIIFDGGIDTAELALEDWELIDTEPEPKKAQFAATFKGNVDASFSNCKFTRYMHEYGGAFFGYYGEYDWTQPGDELYACRDNKYCKLNISLFDCDFFENTAYYAGGAIYLEGLEDNISLYAERCSFNANTSTVGRFDQAGGYASWLGEGGGAIFSRRANISLYKCSITANVGNLVYTSANGDGTKGGGIACNSGTLNMIDCLVEGNTASVGGGVSLLLTKTNIDGCVISENNASTKADFYHEDWDFGDEGQPVYLGLLESRLTGMQTGAGYAGGIYASIEGPVYVTVVNTKIVFNTAQIAYGGFYAFYSESYVPIDGFGSVDFVFSTYANNRSEYDFDDEEGEAWFSIPGDIWEIPFVAAFGCVIFDDSLGSKYLPHETPNENNNYNYFALSQQSPGDNAPADFEVPSELVKTIYEGRFENSIGQFYVGTNYNPEVTLRLDAEGGTISQRETTHSYGQVLVLPEPTKKGYDFLGWHHADGKAFAIENLMFSVDVEAYDIHAKWASSPRKGLPLWGIALFALVAIGACGGILIWRKSKKPALADKAALPELESNGDELDGFAIMHRLTMREKEIAEFLLEGKTQKEIAGELGISAETVKTHVKNLYEKANVKSKYELFAKTKK